MQILLNQKLKNIMKNNIVRNNIILLENIIYFNNQLIFFYIYYIWNITNQNI